MPHQGSGLSIVKLKTPTIEPQSLCFSEVVTVLMNPDPVTLSFRLKKKLSCPNHPAEVPAGERVGPPASGRFPSTAEVATVETMIALLPWSELVRPSGTAG